MQKLILTIAIAVCTACQGICQQNPVLFIAHADDDSMVQHMYDSLGLPLLVVNNNVYSIASECITRALDAGANDRGVGGGANKRSNNGGANNRDNAGNANDRTNNADANDRVIAGGAADRAGGGGHNNRNNGGNANNRNNAANSNDRSNNGDANDRNNAAALLTFYCAIDKNGKLLLYFKNIHKKDQVRVYYGHSFFNSRYYKIIPL